VVRGKKNIFGDENHLSAQLQLFMFKEDDMFIVYCPAIEWKLTETGKKSTSVEWKLTETEKKSTSIE
jgi:hypothetical protein